MVWLSWGCSIKPNHDSLTQSVKATDDIVQISASARCTCTIQCSVHHDSYVLGPSCHKVFTAEFAWATHRSCRTNMQPGSHYK